jgi:energy-coupling factor transporter ATP-binding protein EcfA2
VAWNGEVFAFTGPSGAGKSTLIAALGNFGLPMFCDDTLVLDLSDPDRITCLPGHKRLKLTSEALGLTGAVREEKVGTMIDKFYARPPGGVVAEPLPLGRLVFLEDGPELAVGTITGAERFARLTHDHYTEELFASARQLDRAAQFVLQARLARQIPMAQLTRPHDPAHFAASAQLAAALVQGQASWV